MNMIDMLQSIWTWILCNAHWLFSGVGIALIGILFGRKKLFQRQTKINNKITIEGNKDSSASFDGANFGIITKEVGNDNDKKTN